MSGSGKSEENKPSPRDYRNSGLYHTFSIHDVSPAPEDPGAPQNRAQDFHTQNLRPLAPEELTRDPRSAPEFDYKSLPEAYKAVLRGPPSSQNPTLHPNASRVREAFERYGRDRTTQETRFLEISKRRIWGTYHF
nr:hypothetical protein CFP56_11723 [Quercus suber]